MRGRVMGASFALVLGACAAGDPGLFIQNAVSPDESCVFATDGNALLRGVLDVSAARVEYNLVARYVSQLRSLGQSGMSGPPAADPNIIRVMEAQVELRDVTGAPLAIGGLPNPFTVPTTGVVPSGDGMTFGEAVGAIPIVPAVYGEALRGFADTQILASVRAVGTTLGGADVVTPEFLWPIDLCNGCLFACVTAEDGAMLCQPSCMPGQDRLTITPAACGGGPLGGCVATM